jgi:hypothetical protein
MEMQSRLRLGSFFPALAVVLVVAGCGSDVQVDDDGEGGAGGSSPCPADMFEVDECAISDCIVVDGALCKCTVFATCESYESEVATCDGSTALSCRSVTACGETVFCEEYETCTAVPTCDPGDDEVPGCPNDGSPCYQAELCGSVISCVDNGLAHGCPATPPLPDESCTELDKVCEYPAGPGCFDIYTCVDPFLDGSSPPPPNDPIPGGGGSGADAPVAPYVWQSQGTACKDGDEGSD